MQENEYPHLTVATVVQRDGLFLIVEELINGQVLFNQPAGHVEPGETLFDAARRETLEETGWTVELIGLLGAAHYTAPDNGVSYCRISFAACPVQQRFSSPPDSQILASHWLSAAEIERLSARMRSPLVLSTLHRFLDGRVYPLNFLY